MAAALGALFALTLCAATIPATSAEKEAGAAKEEKTAVKEEKAAAKKASEKALTPEERAAETEKKQGREASAELEKQYKLVKDEAVNARVERIGKELAKLANETEVHAYYGSPKIAKFDYVFKVLDDKDVNALSMPGGFVYINKGLLDYVQSDDELAAVIAHEIAHISHHHMQSLLKEQSKLNNQLAVALLAAIVAKGSAGDVGNLMMGAQMVQIARLNGYSRQAEKDADMTAIAYLAMSKSNPVGILTFMERLARDEVARPAIEWGIYQTHPYPAERSRDILDELRKRNVPIDRRAVTTAAMAELKKSENKPDVFEAWVGGAKMFEAAAVDGQSSEDRAKAIVEKLNMLLNSGVSLRDIRRTTDPPAISARGELLLQVTEADASLSAPMTAADILREAYNALYRTLVEQDLQQVY